MNALNKKYKLFIVISLVLLVVGMTIFGIFGFNQAIDFKKGYEVRVSIDNNVGNAKSVLEDATESYFDAKGIVSAEYAFQKMDDGKTLVYKFREKISVTESDIETYVQNKLDTDVKNNGVAVGAGVVEVDAFYGEVLGNDYFEVGWLLLALGIGVVITYVYAKIREKLSGATATVGASLLASLLFVAVMGITRIPAYPFVGYGIALAAVLAAALSIATVGRCKEELKNSASAKLNTWQVADKVMKYEGKKYLFTVVAVLIAAVALVAFIVPYLIIAAGQMAIAGLCACFAAYFGAPLVWAAIKGSKKKKA